MHSLLTEGPIRHDKAKRDAIATVICGNYSNKIVRRERYDLPRTFLESVPPTSVDAVYQFQHLRKGSKRGDTLYPVYPQKLLRDPPSG